MHSTLSILIKRLNNPALSQSDVIQWGSPVPSFGDIAVSKVATLGLNPSNREFVDQRGNELVGENRRFHSLSSLGLKQWSEVKPRHLESITKSCISYFSRNPYDGWFKALDQLISGTGSSYYRANTHACHLDLIPYATASKWTNLSSSQQAKLLEISGDTLGLLLRNSPVQLLILNGQTVVNRFQDLAGVSFEKEVMSEWTLPRRSGLGVCGYSYKGTVSELAGVQLNREVVVIGFNHNIQSSFGVTNQVKGAIRSWIAQIAEEALA